MYLLPTTRSAFRPRHLRGLGVAVTTNPLAASLNRTFISTGPTGVHAVGPRVYGWWKSPLIPGSGNGSAPASSASTAAQVAGTPVPVGFSVNSPFIASDGSQWEYSTAQGVWINVGTPYNLAAPSAATPTATPTVANASTAAQVAGTPVPVGTSTTQIFTDAYGDTWQYSPSYGVWVETYSATATSTALTTASSAVPAGTSTAAPYTDASGNTWTYNATIGQWVMTAAASGYSSILNWLTQQTLISGIPNWIIAAGVGFVALKFSQSGRR